NDLCFRCEGAESQAHEKNGSHAERETEDVDLTDQVAQADGKKQRENRLRADDLAGQTNHANLPRSKPQKADSAGPATGGTGLFYDSVHQLRRRWRRIGVLVFEIHRLPLELAHLVKWLNLDPFDVLHRRNEFGDAIDIGRIVGKPRHKGEAYPYGLVQFRKTFG